MDYCEKIICCELVAVVQAACSWAWFYAGVNAGYDQQIARRRAFLHLLFAWSVANGERGRQLQPKT
jgi:hypothetical protein